MRPVVTDAVRTRVRELHAAGKGRNEIAAELGLAAATITKVAKQLGLSFDRADSAVAVAARVRTLKERRVEKVAELFDWVDELMQRGRAPQFETLVRTEGGGEMPDTLDFVPTPAVKDLVTSVSSLLTSAAKLELQDADQGVEDARSLLLALGSALGVSRGTDGSENAG